MGTNVSYIAAFAAEGEYDVVLSNSRGPETLAGLVAELEQRPSRRGGIRKSASGRMCEATGCTTLLSVYNHSAYCWTHAPKPASPRK